MNQKHIYTVESYPQVKEVLVDGVKIKNAFYADTKKGFVRHYDDPPRVHKHGKDMISRTVHGCVEVVLND